MQVSSYNSQLQFNQVLKSGDKEPSKEFANVLQQALQESAAASPTSPSTTISSGQSVPNNSTSSQNANAKDDPLHQAFNEFVGQTFFAELIKSYRSTQEPAAYFNGGRAEKIFQGQLDQMLSEQLSESSADKIADPMYELFLARRAG